MDKRQEKTLDTIFTAFAKLVHEKDYSDITIQDILDEAKIGRSTFYLHFKTKNDLLLTISKNIFDHVFSHSLQEEKSHDFSKENFYDYKHLITHIFYHVRDEKQLITGIISSNGNQVFLNEFETNLYTLADSYFSNYPISQSFVPIDLRKSILVNNFIVILKYWIKDDFQESPEKLTDYYIAIFYSKN